ncbi:MAG: 2-C-methyl-D-erythritol 4-phosphate cytidylyltransferase, partial [Cyclobacteriaceae bacterium]|nr:2-C-methyl-D-erythritol 4-phosphate cytidylyltransferase [Cyclobacteriaceae bacterium]
MAGRYALIVAGGTGQRMNSPVPKQFLPVHGKPVIAYTIEAFRQADAGVHLVIVLGRGNEQQWEAIRRTYFSDSEFLQAPGGNTRFQSVKNGLALVPNEGAVVAIHDAVRPCIDPEIIVKSFRQADEIGSAVVSVPVKDSIRVLSGDRSLAQDRSLYRLVQTPQVFRA